ncbi:hypothetical protein BS50DRAFT_647691, partial [Corynespora cassiicola Philippines]
TRLCTPSAAPEKSEPGRASQRRRSYLAHCTIYVVMLEAAPREASGLGRVRRAAASGHAVSRPSTISTTSLAGSSCATAVQQRSWCPPSSRHRLPTISRADTAMPIAARLPHHRPLCCPATLPQAPPAPPTPPTPRPTPYSPATTLLENPSRLRTCTPLPHDAIANAPRTSNRKATVAQGTLVQIQATPTCSTADVQLRSPPANHLPQSPSALLLSFMPGPGSSPLALSII